MPSGRNFPGLPGFGISRCRTGCGSVGSVAQLFSDFFEERRGATGTLFDLAPRHPVRARCLTAPVAGEPSPSRGKRSAVTYEIEQIREDLIGVRGTPPIQLALHVEDERGIHRAGHQPASCLHCCIHCLPSPCGRLSRPRTTTKAPPLCRRDHRSLRSSCPRRGRRRGQGFSGSVDDLSSALGADFTPCGIRPSGLAGFPEGWRADVLGHPRFAPLNSGPALHRSCDRPAHFRSRRGSS